jgi:hypothetical protein
MRLMTRMTVAIAMTVLAALVLYLVFLNDDHQAHAEVLPVTGHHLTYSPSSGVHSGSTSDGASVTGRGEAAWRSRR